MPNRVSGGRVVRFGEFQLDLESGELEQNDRRLILPEQPFRLLAILVRERGALVTRDDLRRELWRDETFVDFEPGLNAAVKRVREMLGDSAVAPRFIETLPKRGYRFIAPVQDVPEQTVKAAGVARTIATPASSDVDRLSSAVGYEAVAVGSGRRDPPGRVTRVNRRWTVLVLAIGITAVVGVANRSFRIEPTSGRANPVIERLSNDGSVRMAALSPDGRDIAYVRGDGVRESLWLKRGDNTSPTRLLEPVDGTFRSLTFVEGETLQYMLFRPDKSNVQPFRISTGGGSPKAAWELDGRVSFNRDGSRCAYVSTFTLMLRESRIVVSDANGNDARVIIVRRPPHNFFPTKPAWSPDGGRLVVFGMSETAPTSPDLLVIDVASGRVLKTSRLPLVVVNAALWLPDGQHVVVSGRQSSATAQRLWLFSLAAETLRPLTTDLSDYSLVGLSASQQVVAVRGEVARSLWIAALTAPSAPEEIARNAGDIDGLEGLAWASADDIVYTAAEYGNVDIWSASVSRRTSRRLTSDPGDDFHPSAAAEGGMVVFASTREESPGLWTMDPDGGHQKRLTTGVDVRPSISRDGRLLVFQRGGAVDMTRFTLWRLAISENTPAEIADYRSMRPAVSPDARSIAHYWMTAEAWMLAVTPTSGGAPARALPISQTHAARVVRWSPDGRALAFIDGAGGASNIWLQPLDGSPAQKLTRFSEGRITTFDWSPDGSTLAWTRVNEVRDLVALDVVIDDRRP